MKNHVKEVLFLLNNTKDIQVFDITGKNKKAWRKKLKRSY